MQDGGGLFLKVDGQSKSWVYRYQLKKKRRKIGFGPYPVISLKAALERYREAQVLVRLRTHNQNMTVAARAIAERKTVGDLS